MANKKVVFITGGTRGIGKSIALGLAQKGYSIKVAGRDADVLAQTLLELKTIDSSAEGFVLDVSQREPVEETLSRFPEIYGLVTCAGIYGPIGRIDEVDLDQWKKTFDVNVMGSAYAVAASSKAMKKQKRGRIVLFGGGGQGGMPGFSAYVSTKGAIVRFCETVAAELKDDNIFVNAVAPGFVMTELQQNVLRAGPHSAGADFFEKVKKADAESGGVSPDLSVNICAYLLSDNAQGLYGKLLSAQWDEYEKFGDKKSLSKSDIYTLRRVMSEDGGTRPPR